jgi:hypothetical protein
MRGVLCPKATGPGHRMRHGMETVSTVHQSQKNTVYMRKIIPCAHTHTGCEDPRDVPHGTCSTNIEGMDMHVVAP